MHPRRTAMGLAVAVAFAGGAHGQNLPAGHQVTAGGATVSQTSATAMVVTQTTDKAALNWVSFNIGQGHSVRFDQPSASSIALNRVTGGSRSEIYGSLSANGQVFLVNPNGILFGRGAQVDVGGLVASTLAISDRDFLDGKYVFSDASNRNAVVNEGSLKAGYLALIGHQAANRGEMLSHLGSVVLAGAGKAQLTLADNKLVKFEVSEAALDALADNGGLIRANGGRVILTAGAKGSLLASTVNNSGLIEAQTVERQAGDILLLSGMEAGTTHVGGRIDASAPDGGDGGFIETSGAHVKMKDGFKITTAAPQGRTGTWLIDPQDYTIAASGGDITGAQLSAALGSSDVSIVSASGATAGNGDIHVNDAVSWSTNKLTLTAERDININALMTASGTSVLEMNTPGSASVKVGRVPGATSFLGRVDFAGREGGPAFGTAGFLRMNLVDYNVVSTLENLQNFQYAPNSYLALGANIDAADTATWNGGQGFIPLGSDAGAWNGRFEGLGHVISNLWINRPGSYQQGLFGLVGGEVRNVGLVGHSVSGLHTTGALGGRIQGTGTISNTFASGTVQGDSGLGGLVGSNAGTVSASHGGGSVTASGLVSTVGGLAGENLGTIETSTATAAVTGVDNVGGLVGDSYGTVRRSWASGSVTSANATGGLVGILRGAAIVRESYATGQVSGDVDAGGLAGSVVTGGRIVDSYATGAVSGSENVGGLVGHLSGRVDSVYSTGAVSGGIGVGGLIGKSTGGTGNGGYWDTQTSGQAFDPLALGRTSAQMTSAASFNTFNVSDSSSSGTIWRIYEGQTAPLLRSHLTPLVVTADPVTRTYDGTGAPSAAGMVNVTYSLASANGSPNVLNLATPYGTRTRDTVGTYSPRLWSNQQGYDITMVGGTLTVAPRPLPLDGLTATDKVYDGTTAVVLSGTPTLAPLAGDNVFLDTWSGTFADKHAGSARPVLITGGLQGTDAANYVLAAPALLTANITKAPLQVTGLSAADKVYDATTAATLSGTASFTALGGDAVTVNAVGIFADKNAGSGKAVTVSFGGTDGGNYYPVFPGGLSASISKATLQVTGLAAADKVYDATTVATLTGTATYTALSGDVVTVNAAGAFADKHAGSGKAVTVGGALGGADGGNYEPVFQTGLTATISKAALPMTGLSVANKVYDATTDVTVTGTPAVTPFAGDSVGLDTWSAAFVDKNAGSAKPVVVNGSLNGTDASNYVLAVPTSLTANITPAPLQVTGFTATNKVYDASADAWLTGAPAVTSLGFDDVRASWTGSAHYADRHVGTAKAITIPSLALIGADAANYTLVPPVLASNITRAPLSLDASVAAKVYDGTTAASLNGPATIFPYAGDNVVLSGTGIAQFASRNADFSVPVTISGFTISGPDAGNYTLDMPTLAAQITPRPVQFSGLTAQNKVYDGTDQVILSGTAGIAGKIAGDDLSVGILTSRFMDRNARPASDVIIHGSLAGADQANYTLQASFVAANVAPAPLAVTGLTALPKTYDGTTSVALSGTPNLVTPLIGTDQAVLDGTALGQLMDKNAGLGRSVAVSGLTLLGPDAPNYMIVPPTLTTDVARAPLSVVANDLRKTQGTTYSFAGTEFSATGLATGDAVSSVMFSSPGAAPGAAVGSHVIMPSGASGAGFLASNYLTTYVDGAMTVVAAPVTANGNPGVQAAIRETQEGGQGPESNSGAGPRRLSALLALFRPGEGGSFGQRLINILGAGIRLPQGLE